MPSLLALAQWLLAATSAVSQSQKVDYATADRVFIRVGSDEGVRLGTELKVQRSARDSATCRVDQLAAHRASCPFVGGMAGALVRYKVEAPAQPASQPARREPLATQEQVTFVQRKLAVQPSVRVDFKHQGSGGKRQRWRTLEATVEHTTYLPFGARGFQRERLDMTIEGLNLGFLGFAVFARASVIAYADGASALRLRPNEVVQLYVWQLEMSSREIGRPFALAIGRIAPQFAPGLAMVDGAQVGWRSRDGRLEIGAVGGLLPDGLRLIPRINAYTASLYYGHEVAPTGVLRWLRHSGRAGVRGQTGVDIALELEEAIDLRAGRFLDVSAQARVTMRAGEAFLPRIELAATRVAARPIKNLELSLDGRYIGSMGADFDNFGTSYWIRGDRLRLALDGVWRPLTWLSLGVESGIVQDFVSQLGRQYVGPMVQLTSLAAGHFSAAIGYREEFGWTRGRFVYAQTMLNFDPWIRVILRASFAEDAFSTTSTDPWRELGGYLFTQGWITPWLRWFVQGSLRGGLTPEQLGAPTLGLVARAGVSGVF